MMETLEFARAPLLELFASIQGEGAYLGRAAGASCGSAGCPLRCTWCDTPGSWKLGSDDERPARVSATTDGDQRGRDRGSTPFQAACTRGSTSCEPRRRAHGQCHRR